MALLAVGLSACRPGPLWGIVPSRTPLRELTQLKAVVVCVSCSLEQARAAYPTMDNLYELRGVQGQLVLRVDWVNDTERWRQVAFGRRLSVRADARVFQQLTAEEHRLQEILICGLLSPERTLDIASATVLD
ncbi:MAG TPA: hypothetical protein VNN62_07755 [Methylomirabilota bacterium]|nr:hypothetical protein [Methylomirabilota bacterium]